MSSLTSQFIFINYFTTKANPFYVNAQVSIPLRSQKAHRNTFHMCRAHNQRDAGEQWELSFI